MTRKMRYRQVLRHRCAKLGKGVYAQQVRLQQTFFKEDKSFNLDISKVREIHSSLGTWDKITSWFFYDYGYQRVNKVYTKGKSIFPKANYKPIKKAQEDIWKEQEQRTLEFFEMGGC